MDIILMTVGGALILIWGAILALIKWVQPLQNKHLLSFGGYVSVVSGVLIFLVIQTSTTQQEAALQVTRERLDKSVENFRDKLSEQTAKLFGQVAEKADLTKTEWQVRGDLQTEKTEHARTRKELGQARVGLRDTQTELIKEAAAHNAYVDSMNTARALNQSTLMQLNQEKQELQMIQAQLGTTQATLSKTREALANRKADLKRMNSELRTEKEKSKAAIKNNSAAQDRLMKKLVLQSASMETIQASIDSIFRKVLKHHRIPVPGEK
jgi:chromosome segregation ATPase